MKFTVLKVKKRVLSGLRLLSFPYAVTVQLENCEILTINSWDITDDHFLLHVLYEITDLLKKIHEPSDSALKIKSILNRTFDTTRSYDETASTIKEA